RLPRRPYRTGGAPAGHGRRPLDAPPGFRSARARRQHALPPLSSRRAGAAPGGGSTRRLRAERAPHRSRLQGGAPRGRGPGAAPRPPDGSEQHREAASPAGGAWVSPERESWIWIAGRFVPYPFQNNLHRLDPADRDRAFAGLERAAASRRGRAANFGEWIVATFGKELAAIFFFPYNRKVWGYPLERLGVSWMGERVAVPDLERVRRTIATGRDDVSWGPNNMFRFPLDGGTGAIWKGVAAVLPAEQVLFGAEVVAVRLEERVVELREGRRMPFDTLV